MSVFLPKATEALLCSENDAMGQQAIIALAASLLRNNHIRMKSTGLMPCLILSSHGFCPHSGFGFRLEAGLGGCNMSFHRLFQELVRRY